MRGHNQLLSRGVGRNLFIAFLAVSLFSLASAMVGWFGLGNVRDVQNRVLNEVYPSVRNAQIIARESTEWVLQLSSMFESRTIDQLDARTRTVKSSEKRISELLSEVGDEVMSQSLRSRIEPNIKKLSTSADSVATLARKVILTNNDINQKTAAILKNAETIIDTISSVTPSIAENTIVNSEDILRELRSGDDVDRATVADKFEIYSRSNMDDLQKVIDLQFRSEAILEDLIRFGDAGSADGVKIIRDALFLNVRALTRSVVRFRIPEIQQKLATPLSRLSVEVFRDDSIFALRDAVFDNRAEMNDLRTSAAAAEQEISALVEQFVLDTQNVMANESSQAQATAARTQFVLMSIAGLAFLVSAVVFLFYVNRVIITRLHRLSSSVARLTSGDLAKVVTATGNDQITRLEEAIEGFRTNALRLRDAEIELTEYSENLERSNNDLQQFAYAASHDLRAPLRGINSLAEWVEEDLVEGNTDEAVSKLSRLRGRALRMDSLLNGILRYSRASYEGGDGVQVPFVKTAQQIFDDLNVEGRFRVSIASNTEFLFSGESFIHQVLGNLISNSMKHHDKATGTIEIELQCDAYFNKLSVSDDGPGIPEEMRGKVLQMFQTLKPRDEVEASGIGLALVERLTTRRKGTVEIHDSAAGGTTCSVQWPCEVE